MSKYRDRTRKTVTLPSGAVAVVVRLAPIHLIELGDIPIADFQDDPKKGPPKERTGKSMAAQIKLQNVILKNCVLSFEFEGEKSKLVDKLPADCQEGEISVNELEPSDAQEIARAVNSFSEGRLPEGAKTFPEGKEHGRSNSLNGESLRTTPDAVTQEPVVA